MRSHAPVILHVLLWLPPKPIHFRPRAAPHAVCLPGYFRSVVCHCFLMSLLTPFPIFSIQLGSRLVVSTVLTPLLLTTSLLVFLLIFASRSYLSSQAWIYSTVIPHGNHSPPSNLPVYLCSFSHIALASHQSSEIQQIIVQPYHSKFQKGADKISNDGRPNIGLHWKKHCIH